MTITVSCSTLKRKKSSTKLPIWVTDFAKSFCLTTHRSWLLMVDPLYGDYFRGKIKDPLQYNLYILHLLTGERINLPTLESAFRLTDPIFWIGEKTKDYLVIRRFNEEDTVSFKRGDNSWNQIPHLSLSCFDHSSNMLYKDHKLYCLIDYKLKVFDLTGQIPLLVFEISVQGCIKRAPPPHQRIPWISFRYHLPNYRNNVVVTLSGDVLIVNSIRPGLSKIRNFSVYKLKGNNLVKTVSLGDEAILLDLGITVLAKDIHGVKKNSIYFSCPDFGYPYDHSAIFVFNLKTNKAEKPHQSLSSSIPFLPSFKTQ